MLLTTLFVRMIKVIKWRKVTYTLSISECTSSQKQQVEKEKNKIQVTHHTFGQNDKRYEVVKTNLPPEHQKMHKFTEVASGEREKSTSLPTICVRIKKVSMKQRKRKMYIPSHTLCQNDKKVRMKYSKSNLPSEQQQMHKFTEVASGKREKIIHVTHHTICQNYKSNEVLKTNLPSEHTRMQKFTEIASREREKSTSLPTLLVRMIKVMKYVKTNLPSEHQQMHKFTEVASGEREKNN